MAAGCLSGGLQPALAVLLVLNAFAVLLLQQTSDLHSHAKQCHVQEPNAAEEPELSLCVQRQCARLLAMASASAGIQVKSWTSSQTALRE